jgi:hypothetical protein
MQSRILIIMTSLPFVRKEKHCKLAVLCIKVIFSNYVFSVVAREDKNERLNLKAQIYFAVADSAVW